MVSESAIIISVGFGSCVPFDLNSGVNFGRMYVSRKIVTPVATTIITAG